MSQSESETRSLRGRQGNIDSAPTLKIRQISFNIRQKADSILKNIRQKTDPT